MTGATAERAPSVQWRPASSEDARLLWEWRNDPVTRDASFSSEEIPFDVHCRWLDATLAAADRRLLILLDEHRAPIGQVRLDFDGPGRATVNIGLGRAARGRGYGAAALRAIGDAVFAEGAVATLVAYIKPGNRASGVAFGRAGFRIKSTNEVNGHRVETWVRCKEADDGQARRG